MVRKCLMSDCYFPLSGVFSLNVVVYGAVTTLLCVCVCARVRVCVCVVFLVVVFVFFSCFLFEHDVVHVYVEYICE